METVNRSLMTNSLIQMSLVMVALFILFSLYSAIMERQKKASNDLLKAKSDFLANMSHEIRTPINTILGMDEMILRESREKDVRKYALDIQQAGKMLISLINDVLDFSRIDAGKLELVPDEYDLALLISDMIDIIRIRADKKGITLDVNMDSSMPHILYGDNILCSRLSSIYCLMQ